MKQGVFGKLRKERAMVHSYATKGSRNGILAARLRELWFVTEKSEGSVVSPLWLKVFGAILISDLGTFAEVNCRYTDYTAIGHPLCNREQLLFNARRIPSFCCNLRCLHRDEVPFPGSPWQRTLWRTVPLSPGITFYCRCRCPCYVLSETSAPKQ